jgi:hypothetical protein
MTYEFELSSTSGLSEIEAAKRLQEEGYNELPFSGKRSVFRIAFEIIREPMFLLLIACGTIYLSGHCTYLTSRNPRLETISRVSVSCQCGKSRRGP